MTKVQNRGIEVMLALLALLALLAMPVVQVAAQGLPADTPYHLAVDPRNFNVNSTPVGSFVYGIQLQAITVDAATRTHRIPVDNITLRWIVYGGTDGRRRGTKSAECTNVDYCEQTFRDVLPLKVECWSAHVRDRRGDQFIEVGQCNP